MIWGTLTLVVSLLWIHSDISGYSVIICVIVNRTLPSCRSINALSIPLNGLLYLMLWKQQWMSHCRTVWWDRTHGCWGHSPLILLPSFLCSCQFVSPPIHKRCRPWNRPPWVLYKVCVYKWSFNAQTCLCALFLGVYLYESKPAVSSGECHQFSIDFKEWEHHIYSSTWEQIWQWGMFVLQASCIPIVPVCVCVCV